MKRRDWYCEFEEPSEEHPVDLEIQARLDEDTEYQELRGQVLELSAMLTSLLRCRCPAPGGGVVPHRRNAAPGGRGGVVV